GEEIGDVASLHPADRFPLLQTDETDGSLGRPVRAVHAVSRGKARGGAGAEGKRRTEQSAGAGSQTLQASLKHPRSGERPVADPELKPGARVFPDEIEL